MRKTALRRRSDEILGRLKAEYPEAGCALRYENPLHLLIATILSAQCTDARVNQITPALFRTYPTARAFAEARQEDLEEGIHSAGVFRNKAKNIRACCAALVERHGGGVPPSMAELTSLAGVGRKTAAVVLGNAFGINDGIPVDTHVQRLSGRLGLSKEKDANKIERDLMELFPRDDWAMTVHRIIAHGRAVCAARKPACERCILADICPSAGIGSGRS